MKNMGFTLAEVLITLGIIGVVATMFIPNVVQEYRKHVVEVRLKEFYTIMQQAFKLAEAENGDISNWGRYNYEFNDVYHSNSDDWFDKYISPHLKEYKQNTRDETSGKGNFNDLFTLRVLSNGSAFSFNTNVIYFFPFAKDYYKCVQYGANRLKKCGGTKYFKFLYYTDSKITPYDYPYHLEKSGFSYDDYRNRLRREQLVGSIGSCSKKSIEAGREPSYCAELIMLEGWKIPNDYPFRF